MNLEDQELLFNVFHDGTVTHITDTKDSIQFTVEIMYLAERLKPHFHGVSVKLLHPAELYYQEIDTDEIKSGSEELDELDLEILRAEINGDMIKIFCSVKNGQSFGCLFVKTDEIQMFDPENNQISLDVLKAICDGYWDEFRNRGQ